MSGDVANPRVWINASVFTAPLGSTVPTDTTSPLDPAWLDVGLLSEDGMTESRSDATDDKYAHGGILIRTTRSKHKRTMKVIMLEDNPVVFSLVNPGSTKATASGITTRTVKVPNRNPVAFLIDLVDGNVTTRRIIPRGEILDVADVKISDSEMTMHEVTINIYPDSGGVLYVDVTDDPQAI